MSLILEALKKSEAERRLGHVPGLLDQGPLQRRGRGTRPLRWVALLVLVVGVAGTAFWLGQRETSAPAFLPEATTGHAPAAAQADAEPAVSNPPEQSSASTEAPVAAAPTPVAAPTAPPPSRLPSDPGFASVEREARAQIAAPLPSPAMTPSAEVPSAPSVAPAPLAPAAPTAMAAPPEATAADSLPSVSSLGPEARGQLPPLKVSMHVFTEDPDGRVVIIDGRRLREGDTVSDGVRLAEIRRDGSVLEIGGRRLLLARP